MIKAGLGDKVAHEMTQSPKSVFPTESLSKLANIAWRINRPTYGLKLLFPEIRRRESLKEQPDPEMLTEYAGCLLEIGALSEAKMILRKFDGLFPRSRFYLALLLFKEWDYAGAIPVLQRYLEEIPEDYHQMVVRVNLAAADVINGRWDESRKLLHDLIPRLERERHHLLLGNCYEIESQTYFQTGEHQQALKILEQSERLLAETKNMGWLYCKKWQFLNRLSLAGRMTAELAAESEALRKTAQQMSSWETLRELDLYISKFNHNERLANHVYFGSPQTIYRERVRQMIGSVPLKPTYAWVPSPSESSPILYDLQHVLSDSSQSFLVKKLLLTLASDYYAGFRSGHLFSQIFEGEFYNPETSPDRVFQLVRRLRRWMKEMNWNCKVMCPRDGYRLHFHDGSGIIAHREWLETSLSEKTNVLELNLRRSLGDREFSSKDVSSLLSCSTRSANRVLRNLRAKGRVLSFGRGRFTRFKWTA